MEGDILNWIKFYSEYLLFPQLIRCVLDFFPEIDKVKGTLMFYTDTFLPKRILFVTSHNKHLLRESVDDVGKMRFCLL